MANFIPCQCCGQQYSDEGRPWYVCDTCGYRICMSCYSKHSGPGNGNNTGGGKCSQCRTGWLHLKHGIKSEHIPSQPSSKLDEYLSRARGQMPVNKEKKSSCLTSNDFNSFHSDCSDNSYRSVSNPEGVIFTNTKLIAQKYTDTKPSDVYSLLEKFAEESAGVSGMEWAIIDMGSDDMKGAVSKDASWVDYAQLLSDYCDGLGIPKSAHTPLFIVGGGDVIPMPEFFANTGNDYKTVEDSDLLYCFPIDYQWKKVSIKDAIFNVSRLPLDFVGKGNHLASSLYDDIGSYLSRALNVLADGIPVSYAMMTSNAGKNGRNDWTWTSADVMAKLPQQQLDNDGILTKDNMFLCPSLDVLGEEYLSNDAVNQYKYCLDNTDMLFINLHGSPDKDLSGYMGADAFNHYFGMTTELVKQIEVPIINAFPCYGARYGKYHFDNTYDGFPEYLIFDREDSMLLTSLYEGSVLLFTGSCTSSMCSNVIGNGSVVDHLNESTSPIDLLMPAGYAEAMLKLYACYLFQGDPAGYAMLKAKIDYLNFRAKYENQDLVFLTLNQFNLFGCPILKVQADASSHQLRNTLNSVNIPAKELPRVSYSTLFEKVDKGIDGVLNRVRSLVDGNLKAIDDKIRAQLYETLGLEEDNLTKIESIEYNGQLSYNMTYTKKNRLFPEYYIVQTDSQGDITDVLSSR